MRPSGKRGERVGRWEYMRPFGGRNFNLASEDWLREFDEMRHEMEHVFEETIQDIENSKGPHKRIRDGCRRNGKRNWSSGLWIFLQCRCRWKATVQESGNIRPLQRSLKAESHSRCTNAYSKSGSLWQMLLPPTKR